MIVPQIRVKTNTSSSKLNALTVETSNGFKWIARKTNITSYENPSITVHCETTIYPTLCLPEQGGPGTECPNRVGISSDRRGVRGPRRVRVGRGTVEFGCAQGKEDGLSCGEWLQRGAEVWVRWGPWPRRCGGGCQNQLHAGRRAWVERGGNPYIDSCPSTWLWRLSQGQRPSEGEDSSGRDAGFLLRCACFGPEHYSLKFCSTNGSHSFPSKVHPSQH